MGTLGGNCSEATGINDKSNSSGTSWEIGDVAMKAFINDALINLGALPGGVNSFGFAINVNDQAVGHSETLGGLLHAFRTNPLSPIAANSDLGTLGGLNSSAFGINVIGVAVGSSEIAGGPKRAFRSAPNGQPNALTNLGVLPGGSESAAHGINAIGAIVGFSRVGSFGNVPHAVRVPPGQGINPAFDIGSLLGPTESRALAISPVGDVVGYMELNPGSGMMRGFRIGPGVQITPTDELGVIPGMGFDESRALGINPQRETVGMSYRGPYEPDPFASQARAFIHTDTEGMRDLNLLVDPITGAGWELLEARGINSRGEIVGIGRLEGQPRAFQLTPMHTTPAIGLVRLGDWEGSDFDLQSRLVLVEANGQPGFALNLFGSAGQGRLYLRLNSNATNTVRVKPHGFLAQRVTVNVGNDEVTLPFLGPDATFGLIPGDADDSNMISDADLTLIILDYGGPQSGANGATDVNGSGMVDDADLTLCIIHFGKEGDS